jgi:hypothetical protein
MWSLQDMRYSSKFELYVYNKKWLVEMINPFLGIVDEKLVQHYSNKSRGNSNNKLNLIPHHS